MNWENGLTTTAGICGLVFIAVSVIMFYFPPKNINHFYGYRTSKSMQSQKHWDFAQRYSSVLMLRAGIVLAMLALIYAIVNFNLSKFLELEVAFILIIGSVIYLFIGTQKALDKRFKE